MSIAETLLFGLATLCFCFYFWGVIAQKKSAITRFAKTASVALLAVVAVILQAPLFIILALAFSSLGDLALTYEGDKPFLLGLSAFALAHVFYQFEFMAFAQVSLIELLATPQSIALIVILALGIGLIFPHAGPLKIPVLGYMGIIFLMGLYGLNLPAFFLLASIGVALFILSDFCLGLERFRPDLTDGQRHGLSIAVWPLYWIGQGMILLGIALA